MKRLLLRLKQFRQQFWFIPAVFTVLALILAEVGIALEERYGVPESLKFIYSGGETGARTLMGAVASSAIGVAGTVFSITIAALSYAAGSMGPRLLDNFTRDRGNQVVLGTFIATFAFTLYSLRAVQGGEENPFVPHYNVTGAMLLALACIAALVYYLAHVTGSINMTRVITLLRDDLQDSLEKATHQREDSQGKRQPPPENYWQNGEVLRAPRGGYLQLVDVEELIKLADREDVALRLHVKPGDYVFTNSVIVTAIPHLPDGVMDTLTLGRTRLQGQDLEYSVRQLTEVASRALSPGVNDPVTAIDVIDRFGDALCRLHDRSWPDGVHFSGDHLRLVRPVTTFGGLLDSMFHMIRQYGKGSPAVTIRMLEVLRSIAACMDDPARHAELRRHAEMIYADALENTPNDNDRADLKDRYEGVLNIVQRPASQ